MASRTNRILDRLIPKTPWGTAFAAVFFTTPLAILGFYLGVHVLRQYGLGLFMAGPFALGFIAALIHSYYEPKSLGSCVCVAGLSILVASVVLFALAWEGLICILMVLPFAFGIAAIGAALGAGLAYCFQKKPHGFNMILIPLLFVPIFMGAEYVIQPQPTLFAVKTFIDVNAPIDVVWKNVVSFAALAEPQELLFKAGVAYPTHAAIKGEGVGAVRECHFSTGTFVEPITVWDENRLLRFNVTSQPPTMKELSPYDVHPPHLENYLVSKQGQFLLIPLPDGTVRLEGTTWYSNKMWPEAYWRIWSDYIIHKIHVRVLEHIKTIAETKTL